MGGSRVITIHEIDNDGRGTNSWQLSKGNNFLLTHDDFDTTIKIAMLLAKALATNVTIYTVENYYKEQGES